jgi:hypothetical protein
MLRNAILRPPGWPQQRPQPAQYQTFCKRLVIQFFIGATPQGGRARGQARGAQGEGGGNRQEAWRQATPAPGGRRIADGQINLTDEASRIMPVAGGGFEQCYNAQAVMATQSLLNQPSSQSSGFADGWQSHMVQTLASFVDGKGTPSQENATQLNDQSPQPYLAANVVHLS